MDKGIGLVFAGGGGRGAYQIGVWKAMRRMGVDAGITAVAGTSVGALNAVLFAEGDYENAERIWRNISPNQILAKHKDDRLGKLIGGAGAQAAVKAFSERIASVAGIGVTSAFAMAGSFAGFIKGGAFSRDALVQLIDDGVDLERVSASDIMTYAVCTELPGLEERDFLLNGNDTETIKDIILASSAIPVVFPVQKVGGRTYCDGGLCDNNPVELLYKKGYRNIISVPLKLDDSLKLPKYRDARVIEIIPKKDLGDILSGTLDFTAEGARRRMDMGYNDAMDVLEPMYEYLDCLNEKKKDHVRYIKDLKESEKAHEESLKRRRGLRDEIFKLM